MSGRSLLIKRRAPLAAMLNQRASSRQQVKRHLFANKSSRVVSKSSVTFPKSRSSPDEQDAAPHLVRKASSKGNCSVLARSVRVVPVVHYGPEGLKGIALVYQRNQNSLLRTKLATACETMALQRCALADRFLMRRRCSK